MKFLVTGISGFAGPHLAKLLLKEGHRVHGIIRCSNGRETDLLDIFTIKEFNKIKFHVCDLKHFYGIDKILKEEKFDGVFHLAAQSHPPTGFKDPILTFEENVSASMNIITSLENTKTKMMFCSTSEVYGDSCKDKDMLRVSDALTPSNPYAASKAAIDLYMQERMKNGFLIGFITRAFSHTGPKRGYNFSISSDAFQIAKMKIGVQEKVLLIGNLKTKRVVIDVRDVVQAYYKLMIKPGANGGIFNICGDKEKDLHVMQYFTDKLIELAGFKPHEIEQRINPAFYRPIDIQIQVGDTTEVTNLINWNKTYSIDRTLFDLLEYWENVLKGK